MMALSYVLSIPEASFPRESGFFVFPSFLYALACLPIGTVFVGVFLLDPESQ